MEGAVVDENGNGEPTKKCLKDATGAEAKSADWKCSLAYTSKDLGITICPQRQKKCGSKQAVEFKTEGDKESITMKGLKKGESCTIKVRAKCGAPGFKLTGGTGDSSKLDISYVEYNQGEVTEDSVTGRPKPTTSFTDQGKQGKGQKRPPRKDAQGNEIKSKDLGKPDDDRKPPPMGTDASKNKDTYSKGGFGKPSSGTYDPSVKGYKTFGTLGQGDKAEGAKDPTKDKCASRDQYVTVTAKQDLGDTDTVLLEVGSYAFDTSSAMAIKAVAASVLAAFSVSQF